MSLTGTMDISAKTAVALLGTEREPGLPGTGVFMVSGKKVDGVWFVKYHGTKLPGGETHEEAMDYARKLRALDKKIEDEKKSLQGGRS